MQELLTSGSANINPRIFPTAEHPLRDSICFTPDIGSYAFSQWNGNAHIRCIRK
ncbi:hypothetical protein [Leptospira kirschneri]|uniref:hypothetical protein n=1 Tax=Leptospira kirschneri TaxID=29507 RepID=UPI000297E393|nr:hypothetical protein [Leptospira kirschneri]EKQ82671.1 hypothetical protein LEP1GSC064_2320 [Leptospira kirschneri serovar Grippotyphosa str. Moskva]EKR07755.1 hypothetical protein LEP1GSC122_2945 [Leptospira kirschneri serovar Valbuzzi str. 200702274]WBF93345.1 hypothetical protein LIX31_09775 [Leptospira kirschneri]